MYNDDIFRSYIRVRGAWVYQLLQFFHSCGTSVLSCIERILEAIRGCIMYIHIYIVQYIYIHTIYIYIYNIYIYNIYIQYIYIHHSRYLMVHQIVHCLSSRDKHEISHYHVLLLVIW